MKNVIRYLTLCLALVFCLIPVLVACDSGEIISEDTTVSETTAGNAEETTAEPVQSPDKNPGTQPSETDPAESEPSATEPTETEPVEPDEDVVFEGTAVAKSENIARHKILKLHKLGDVDANGNTKCSLVLYDDAGNVLNYVLFEYAGNGKAPDILTLQNTVWYEENCLAKVVNADGSVQSFEISYTK